MGCIYNYREAICVLLCILHAYTLHMNTPQSTEFFCFGIFCSACMQTLSVGIFIYNYTIGALWFQDEPSE